MKWLASSIALCLGVMGLIIGFSHSPTQAQAGGTPQGPPLSIVYTSPFNAATTQAPVRGVHQAPLSKKSKRPAVKVRGIDGCNPAYGTSSQCIPRSLTTIHACSYLTRGGFFKTPLQIHSDPLHLMSKRNVKMDMGGKLSTVSGCSD